ncbi:MAG: flagellar basal body rod protein FlgC [Bryobacteraceae bacterium]|nr:flagellar basal body rod protein FlgC [Bryobacteraceae bacterium]MCX7605578.1 flagellar basal body rod protein FlgC [Bryobacteraceae bacterium]
MSLFHLLSVSASGLAAQRARAEVIVENLANAETTRTPEGGPYRRRDVLFEPRVQPSPFSAVFQTELEAGATGVAVAGIVEDAREPDFRYQPGHPHADANGYVAYPRINPAEEMVDLIGAARGYQANVAAMTAVKDMLSKSIDLLK